MTAAALMMIASAEAGVRRLRQDRLGPAVEIMRAALAGCGPNRNSKR